MQKLVCCLSFLTLINNNPYSQKVSGTLQFEKGKTFIIAAELNNTSAQQVAGQPIDFSAKGNCTHSYKVTNITKKNTTLHHQIQQISFHFDGMGQQKTFDSRNEKDMQSSIGSQFKEILEKSFDLTIDSTGRTLTTSPDKIELTKQDASMFIVMNMLKDLTDIVYPPQKGGKSFFSVLPAYEVGIGDTWTDSINTENEKSMTVNTLSAITDSTIVVSFKTNSFNKLKMQMMGMDATSSMNNTANGRIILDKITGIIKEKTSTIDANGTTETSLGFMPTSGKITIVIKVKEE